MPLHAWVIRGRSTKRNYHELKESEFSTRASIEELQQNRLAALVQHAFHTSDFYRKRMAEFGVSPNDLNNLADIQKLPLLSKDDVRRNLESGLLSSSFEIRDLLKISTSGSTGEPFTIYANREQLEFRFAATIRALESTGWRFGEPQVRLWHQTLGMSRSQVFRERFDAFLMNRHFIPAFEFSPRTIASFVSQIENHRPVLLDGYAESLNFLASYLQSGRTLSVVPRAVMSSAQMLPRSTKKIIEDSLNTHVFDKYGSREFSGIAYECEFGTGHHVVDESYIVEVLVEGRRAKPGETGEVVITDLLNYATPLIRYRIGDLATAVDPSFRCPCGRPHSQIGEIQGRTQAIVHCADGTWLPGTFFAHFFKDHEETVRFFQIEQHEKAHFVLKIVPGDRYAPNRMGQILDSLREFVGTTRVEVREVAEIPLVRTGKRSPVVSTVPIDFQTLESRASEQEDP